VTSYNSNFITHCIIKLWCLLGFFQFCHILVYLPKLQIAPVCQLNSSAELKRFAPSKPPELIVIKPFFQHWRGGGGRNEQVSLQATICWWLRLIPLTRVPKAPSLTLPVKNSPMCVAYFCPYQWERKKFHNADTSNQVPRISIIDVYFQSFAWRSLNQWNFGAKLADSAWSVIVKAWAAW
jgi:hypothetical protein